MSSGLLVFAVTYFMAVASPGPGIAAVVARALARGAAGMPAFVAGFVVGDLLWFAMAAAGLTILAQTLSGVFLAIKYAGVAYLLFMAWKLWTAPAGEVGVGRGEAGDGGASLFAAGLALTMSNPKVMVFFLAILPTVVSLENLSLISFVETAGLIALILPSVFVAYIAAAVRARRLFRSPRALIRLNRGTSVVMAGAAVAIAAR